MSIPFETIVKKKHRETWNITSSNEQTRHASTSPRHAIRFSSILFSQILDSYVFLFSLYNPDTHRTIQYLIPGRTTNVEILKQVKNWQSPSRDPWSNCLINSRETTKGQTNYYSSQQKDNSMTICRSAGYSERAATGHALWEASCRATCSTSRRELLQQLLRTSHSLTMCSVFRTWTLRATNFL